jgi:hypothetical protein
MKSKLVLPSASRDHVRGSIDAPLALNNRHATRRIRRQPARKYRGCRSSIAEFHYAAKAWLRNQRGIGRISNEEASFWRERN